MSVTVTLQCKPYVAHYLHSRFGNPVRIHRKSQMRKVFLACIQKQFQPNYDKYVKKLPAQVEVRLNKTDLQMHGAVMSDTLFFFINGFFEERIKSEMFRIVCQYHYRDGLTLRKSILKYQSDFGFKEEVFSVEAIRCAYYDIIKVSSKPLSGVWATNYFPKNSHKK